MHHRFLRFTTRLCLIASAWPIGGGHALAAGHDWTTAAHAGYAVNRQSSTGFKNIGGSLVYFDAGRRLSDSLSVGLRTQTEGGKSSELEFYRLGSGPVVAWLPAPSWRFEAGISLFRESGLAPDGEKIYKSQGRAWTVGWERSSELTKGAEWAYGGFLSSHRGNLAVERDLGAAMQTRLSRQENAGLAQGIQIALRMRLD